MQLRWPAWLSRLAPAALSLPSQCGACRAWPCRDVLCQSCWQRFHHTPRRCTGCALALPGIAAERPRCGQCLQHPPPWVQAHAWCDYSYPWQTLITHWKLGQQPGLARHLAGWMQQAPDIAQAVAQAELLLPIPLSSERLRTRGYNPAAQLVQHLGAARHKQLLTALVRTRDTPTQRGLTRAQRLRNLRQAFAVPQAQLAAIAGRHILLVDDVMTTGATFASASQCLLQAGAGSVSVLCLARTA